MTYRVDASAGTGPSRDWGALAAAEPVYRQERFQIMPQRMPVSLKMQARPIVTEKPIPTLTPSRLPVLIRHSNQRPIEAGLSSDGSVWSVSDPGYYHRADSQLAADPAADGSVPAPIMDANLKARLIMLGIAAGLACYVVMKHRK